MICAKGFAGICFQSAKLKPLRSGNVGNACTGHFDIVWGLGSKNHNRIIISDIKLYFIQ